MTAGEGKCLALQRHFLFPALGSSTRLSVRDHNMAKLSKESKQRLQQLFQCGQFVIRWGFIPTVLYLGQYPNRSEGYAATR